MRHQYRVIAASRRAWIDRIGSFTCPVRLDTGRRYSRQYGHVLPRRRSTTEFGGDAR
jgi:hypothetical protein